MLAAGSLPAEVRSVCWCSHPFYSLVPSSGGCTVAAHGLFLQSGLQPQMVLTTGQDAEVFHVVSNKSLHHLWFWDFCTGKQKTNIEFQYITFKKSIHHKYLLLRFNRSKTLACNSTPSSFSNALRTHAWYLHYTLKRPPWRPPPRKKSHRQWKSVRVRQVWGKTEMENPHSDRGSSFHLPVWMDLSVPTSFRFYST